MGTPKGTKPWNYGRGVGWTDSRGYRWVYVTDKGRRRARREHRHIMEQHLGRTLEPWELVHHKDGNTQNNAIDNLELREWGEHTAAHHLGGRKSKDARRTMEAFALLREELQSQRRANTDLLDALEECEEYFDERADCDHDGERHLPNKEMRLLVTVRAAIAKAKGGQ